MYVHSYIHNISIYIFFFVQIFFIYLPVPPYKELKEQVKEQLKENPIHIYVWVGRWDESDSQEMDKAQ